VVLGGITSAMRQAIKDPIVNRGRTLYIYPQLYEGQECTKSLFCTGPTPAQQCDKLIPYLIKTLGKKRFAMPSANYVWPQLLNKYARKVIETNGAEVVFEEYYPLDQPEYSATISKIRDGKVDCVFNTVIPPGLQPFMKQLHEFGFQKDGGVLTCVYFDENTLNYLPAPEMAGLYSCLDYFQAVDDPFSKKLLNQYDALYPGDSKFTGGSGSSGLYRGLRLWAAAVTEAGSLEQADVIAALDHAQIGEGPGGPAAMVPGQHHVRMHMYIARAQNGRFEIVESLGAMEPQEALVDMPALSA